ncbi:MAG: N-acetyltransferase [Desulfopila sp.]
MNDTAPGISAPAPNVASGESNLSIVMVETARHRDQFIRLPWSIYRDDPVWVPPLIMERKSHLSPKNPYFEHASCRLWLALRDGVPVGRISAQVDQLYLERYGDNTGFWGMIEAEDRAETFTALFTTAERWLKSRGMRRAIGPFNFSINQECGLLVDGFDSPPSMMMGHARPYYGQWVEQCGYRKEKDLLAYLIDSRVAPSATRRRLIRASDRQRITSRCLRKSHFAEDLAIVFTIFNDAWANNWGFVPFTEAELGHLANDLKLLINNRLVRIVSLGEEPAAFVVLLPNLNEAIRDLDGALFPLGWCKLLWRLKMQKPRTGRILLMGVLSKYHETLLGVTLAYRAIHDVQEAALEVGMEAAELSWILEDNTGTNDIIEDFGGVVYKTYRIYGRDISGDR